jgi:hypothetical protein
MTMIIGTESGQGEHSMPCLSFGFSDLSAQLPTFSHDGSQAKLDGSFTLPP